MFSEEKRRTHSDVDGGSVSSSSGDSVSGAPSRLVPGHRMWANRTGRHILGLIEDYNALRKQISEGRKLSRSMDAQLQECLHTLRQQGSDHKVFKVCLVAVCTFFKEKCIYSTACTNDILYKKSSVLIVRASLKVIEQQHLKSLSGSMSTMQHVLEEAGRLLKLVWRVSLPAGDTAGDNQQVDKHKHTYTVSTLSN